MSGRAGLGWVLSGIRGGRRVTPQRRSNVGKSPLHRRLRIELLEERRLLSVTGDYNANSVVDAADYVLWRNSVGLTGVQPADGNGDSVVNELDYGVWRQHVGEKTLPGAFSITLPAPPVLNVEDFDITWSASADAASYNLSLSRFSDGSSPYFSENLTGTSSSFNNMAAGILYVSVTATNAAGTTVVTNDHYQVVIDVPVIQQTIFVTSKNYWIRRR